MLTHARFKALSAKDDRAMEIRKASIEDAPEIARVHIDSWRYAYKGIIEDELLASLDHEKKCAAWESILGNVDWPAYVAVNDDGCIDGFVHLSGYRDNDLENQNVGEVTAIYINPKILGTGVGAQLFRKALEHLYDLGYSKVALWVLEKNISGINFYNKFGFQSDGGKKVHPKTGLVELRYVR